MDTDVQAALARKRAALLAKLGQVSQNDIVDHSSSQTSPPVPSKPASEPESQASDAEANSTHLTKAQLRRKKHKESLQLRKQTEREVRQKQEQLQSELTVVRETKLLELKEVEQEAARIHESDRYPDDDEQSDEDIMEDEELDEELRGLSRRERREKLRISIAALKQSAQRPDLVEAHDCNARDPFLLVALKSVPGAVPVPVHWSQKRKYLIAKKGYDKPLFKLPKHIEDTGITQIRNAHLDEAGMTAEKLKKQMRERARPKMNKMDISYETLYNAFFVHATKPLLTQHGEMYYEGREYDAVTTQFKPGVLSPALRTALGLSDDPATSAITPPPWLAAMQQHGPPPSYPRLAVPGVNAPIPLGARWGLGVSEWGRPPINVNGRPLWTHPTVSVLDPPAPPGTLSITGERVSSAKTKGAVATLRASNGSKLWGVYRPMVAEGEEEVADDQEQLLPEQDVMIELHEEPQAVAQAEAAPTGEQVDDGELESGSRIDAMAVDRIRRRGAEEPPRALYTVLEQHEAGAGSGLFGTSHVYVPSSATSGGVELAISPEELETMDDTALKRKYLETVAAKEQQSEEAASKKKVRMDQPSKLNIF